MKITFAFLLIVLGVCAYVEATSIQTCVYKNSHGKNIYLQYHSRINEGEKYVDYPNEGECSKRATCPQTYVLKLENCADFDVTCENKNTFEGEFPACCVKC